MSLGGYGHIASSELKRQCYVYAVDVYASTKDYRGVKNPKIVLGRAVRENRLRLEMSQEQLAEAAELHRTYIGQVERGETNISLVNLIRIATALRTRVANLVREL